MDYLNVDSFRRSGLRASVMASTVASAVLGIGASGGATFGWNVVLFGVWGFLASAGFNSRVSYDLEVVKKVAEPTEPQLRRT